VIGKLLAALSVWLVLLVITVPYVWFLGKGVGAVGDALGAGATVGPSSPSPSPRWESSSAPSPRRPGSPVDQPLCAAWALFAPTQFPTGGQSGWFGDLLLRVNPISAALHWIGKVVVDGHSWGQDADWLISPVAAAVVLTAIALLAAPRWMRLRGGSPPGEVAAVTSLGAGGRPCHRCGRYRERRRGAAAPPTCEHADRGVAQPHLRFRRDRRQLQLHEQITTGVQPRCRAWWPT